MKRKSFVKIFCIGASLILSGCGSANSKSNVVITINLGGSTSVEKIINSSISKLKSLLPEGVVDYQYAGTGSGDAVSGVTSKSLDIGFLSREIKDEELSLLSDENTRGHFAIDAVVPIVYKDNPLDSITDEALVKVYKGEYTKWSELGETDETYASKTIKLYSREAGSGTRECFFEGIGYKDVAKEDKWNEGVVVSSQSKNADIMSAVGSDTDSIGYCSLDSLSSVTTIKGLNYNGVEPTVSNVLNDTYQLKRYFNYVIRDEQDETKEKLVNAFVDFLTISVEGYNVIKTNGGIWEDDTSSRKLWNDIVEEKYSDLLAK